MHFSNSYKPSEHMNANFKPALLYLHTHLYAHSKNTHLQFIHIQYTATSALRMFGSFLGFVVSVALASAANGLKATIQEQKF